MLAMFRRAIRPTGGPRPCRGEAGATRLERALPLTRPIRYNCAPPPTKTKVRLVNSLTGARQAGRFPSVWIALSVAGAYYLGVQVGMALRFPPATTSVLWPPNATLTAALLLVPVRQWWICLLAAFPAHVIAEVQAGFPLPLIVPLFLSNCSEALVAGGGVRLLSDAPEKLDSLRRVLVFIVCAGVAAPTISSFADAAIVHANAGEAYWTVWRTRTFANALTELSVVPVMLVLTGRITRGARLPALRLIEALALIVSLTLAARLMLDEGNITLAMPGMPRTPLVMLLPFLFWAAIRFGVAGPSAALLLAALAASAAATVGGRPFEGLDPADGLEALQIRLAIMGSSFMCVAGLMDERRDAAAALAERLRFEGLLSGIGKAFLHTSRTEISSAFDRSLELVGRFLDADHVSFQHVLSDEGDVDVVHRWTTPSASTLMALDYSRAFPWTFRRALAGERLVCEGPEAFPPDAQTDCDSFRGLGLQAAVMYPLTIAGRVRGTFSVATLRPRKWSNQDLRQLQQVAEVLANAGGWRHAELELQRTRQALAHTARLSSLGELAASLAHQLNQPLAGILNNAEAAMLSIDSGRASLGTLREIITDIADDDRRAGDVIRRMREMLTRETVSPVRLEANLVVRDVAALIASDTIIRNVSIFFDYHSDALVVVGNKIDLQEALLNVIMNAMDAVSGRAVPDRQVFVRTERANGQILIAVRDRGDGLMAGTEQRIFEPFFTTKPSGMGMGLAVAQSLIEHHGGVISASNDPSGGAVVTISIPAAGNA